MAEQRKKTVTYLTPAGVAQYPRLSKPDTKFKPEGEYKVTLVLTESESEKLRAQIDAAMVESLALAKKDNPTKARAIKAAADKPYKAQVDADGNETGNYAFNFKMKAVIETRTGEKYNKRPSLFDSKGKPLDPAKVSVGGGSIVKVSFELYLFYTALVGAGVSLRLHAVQVIKYVEYSGARDAAGYGFGVEEDGYEGDEVTETVQLDSPLGGETVLPKNNAPDPQDF